MPLRLRLGRPKIVRPFFRQRRAHQKFLNISGPAVTFPCQYEEQHFRQINFSCRKNGYHLVIGADHLRISNHILGLKFNKRIMIQPLHQFFTSQQVGRRALAAKNALAPISYSAALYKVHQSIGEKRRMDSQMFFCGQLHGQGFVERPYTKRYTTSVFNYIGNVCGNFQKNILQRPPGDIKRVSVDSTK